MLMLFVGLLSFTSCAKLSNKIDANGGLVGSYDADWIIVNRSGGVIVDVYKMTNVMVQSEDGSDGWLFVVDGNAVHLSGDVKAIRINDQNKSQWNNYHEYHAEFTDKSYNEFLNDQVKPIVMNQERPKLELIPNIKLD